MIAEAEVTDIRNYAKTINSALNRLTFASQNEISYLCDLYGSDKGSLFGGGVYYPWYAHTYSNVYTQLFTPIRDMVQAVFECGIGTNDMGVQSSMGVKARPGASLRVWRDFFPHAEIIGADIDRNVLFEEDRIATAYIDQTSPQAIADFFAGLNLHADEIFNIIIDDGLHTYDASINLFENSYKYLQRNGYYVIEDAELDDIPRFNEFFSSRTGMKVDYMLMPMYGRVDNNLIIIKKQRA
jgi:hypothetical protein